MEIKYFDYSPIEHFETHLAPDEAVRHFKNLVEERDIAYLNLFPSSKMKIVGKFSKGKILLYVIRPLSRNTFRPYFQGSFVEREGESFLVGKFSMSPYTKMSTLLFSLVILLLGIITLPNLFDPLMETQSRLFPLGSILLLAVVTLVTFSGKWQGKKDVALISNTIKKALKH